MGSQRCDVVMPKNTSPDVVTFEPRCRDINVVAKEGAPPCREVTPTRHDVVVYNREKEVLTS